MKASFLTDARFESLALKLAICGIALFTWCSYALMSPPFVVTPEQYPQWRDSMKMLVFTDTNDDLVEFALFFPKLTKNEKAFLNLTLTMKDGASNAVARTELGDSVLTPDFTSILKLPNLTNKLVQRFVFYVRPEMITNSIVSFRTLIRPTTRLSASWEDDDSETVVRLVDIFTNAVSARQVK
jgi:hypothetical protein